MSRGRRSQGAAASDQTHAGVVNLQPHIPCPECGHRIAVALSDLLTRSAFTCTSCGLVLHMNREENKDALKLAEKMGEIQQGLNETKNRL